ncbi:MAG: serine/threonine protein kinase [Myxococcota bacterium]
MNSQAFGKYQLLKKLATGGMAEVWLARETGIEGFNRLLVVKRILPHLADDPEFVQMFLNEAKIVARLNHPNIAQIYELGETGGLYFIAMEFVHGEDLGRVMRKAWSTGQWIARPLAIRIVASACEALYYAHSKVDEAGRPLRVVHRDISPQNILISFDGSVKVVDFGIAKAADQVSMTKSGAIKGKFAYMSPEQAAGKALDHRSDIFALGLVLYELLTGVRPLKRDSELGTLQAALACAIEKPSAVADVPPELDGVVMAALAKATDDRYRDARAFQMALEELLVLQRWVATSVQVSELMSTLFSDRLQEEARLGRPEPRPREASPSGSQVVSAPPKEPPTDSGEALAVSDAASMEWAAPPGSDSPEARAWGTERPSRTRLRELTKAQGRRQSGAHPKAPPGELPDRQAPPSDEMPDSLLPLPPTKVPRRTSSTGVRKKSSAKLKEASADRWRSSIPSMPKEPTHPDGEASEGDAGIDEMLTTHRQGLKRVVWVGAVVAALALVALFRGSWVGAFSGKGDGEPVLLSVTSNPKAMVVVRHAKSENEKQPEEKLGHTPLKNVRGVHALDTLMLVNDDLGCYHEEVLAPGRPSEVQKIEREFKTGSLKLRITPSGATGLTVWRKDRLMGTYTPGLAIELCEGRQHLELRGDGLRQSVLFDVQIKPGGHVEKTLDISAFLSP